MLAGAGGMPGARGSGLGSVPVPGTVGLPQALPVPSRSGSITWCGRSGRLKSD